MDRLRLRRALGAVLALTCALSIATLAHGTRPGAAAPAAPDHVLVVGDSLAVGMRPSLGALLDGRPSSWSVRSGITTPQGMRRLRSRLARVAPSVVVVSLGTNDGPDPARFRSRVRRALAAIPRTACVVWPDIFRPARKGRYAALNAVLRQEARRDRRLTVVGWLQAVRTGRVALPDGLHPDAAGFQTRSRLVAAAVRRGCH
ncbi:MAG TPA: SGNH/GDSL hydrolase family protein [Baekduia sp.]|nr:SGNH/GDSL hydrolase family protein [Baekduia sp.]